MNWAIFRDSRSDADRYLNALLDPAHTSYRPRPEMEDNPSYKQLIPYCLFQFEDKIFHYRRGTDQGEARLHSKRSVGIGGHISSEDEAADNAYEEGMRREIAEEVFLEAGVRQECIGLINDDETEVGRVHLGVVHRFHLDSPKVRPREASIMETGFAAPSDLADSLEEFESWSQICLEYLLRQTEGG